MSSDQPTTPRSPASDDAGFGAALRRLRDAQKSPKGAPLYSLVVNRPLGRIFAAAAYRFGLAPNQVTATSGIFSFTGIIVLALAPITWGAGLVVGLLLVLGYALDAADGQLARLRGGGSSAGEWLDHMLDATKISSLHLAVLIAFARHSVLPDPMWLLVPIIFTVVAAVHFFGMILVEQLIREDRAKRAVPAPPRQAGTPLRTLLKLPTDYGVLCLSFVVLGAPLVFFGVYSLLALGSAGYLLLIVVKWYHDVAALDRVEDGVS